MNITGEKVIKFIQGDDYKRKFTISITSPDIVLKNVVLSCPQLNIHTTLVKMQDNPNAYIFSLLKEETEEMCCGKYVYSLSLEFQSTIDDNFKKTVIYNSLIVVLAK